MMMLSDVMTQIAHLKKKSQIKDKEIDNLFLASEELSLKKQNITHPSSISYNFLNKLRIDVIDQIMVFLDLHDLLQFRLVSNSANKFVLVILPKKIQVLQNQCQVLESEFKDFLQVGQQEQPSFEELQQLQQARNGLDLLSKQHIQELRYINSPPWMIDKVLIFVQILLNPTYKPAQDSWKSSKLMLGDNNFLLKLKMLDLDQIKEKQIQLLSEVHQIQLNKVQALSYAAGSLFEFVQSVLTLFESKTYLQRRQERQKQQKLKKMKKIISELNKLVKEN